MPAKIKVLKKKLKGVPTEPEIEQIFNQLIGTDEVDITYAFPRFERMKNTLVGITALNRVFSLNHFMNDENSYGTFVDFDNDMIETIKLFDTIPPMKSIDIMFKKVPKEEVKQFTTIYNNFKNSTVIKNIILSASRIKPFVKDIEAKKYDYLWKSPGLSMNLLSFVETFDMFSLKTLPKDHPHVRMWNSYLAYIFKAGKSLNQEINSPDIDIKKFSEIVVQSITAAERDPALNDCKDAFGKIKESMHLLEGNFGKYYHEFVASSNDPMSIFQNFLRDVCDKNSDASVGILAQFTKIINHFTKKMKSAGIKDAKAEKALQYIDSSMKSLLTKAGVNPNTFNE